MDLDADVVCRPQVVEVHPAVPAMHYLLAVRDGQVAVFSDDVELSFRQRLQAAGYVDNRLRNESAMPTGSTGGQRIPQRLDHDQPLLHAGKDDGSGPSRS